MLSEPDTLVADICQEFGEHELNWIKRKLSDHIEFEDETETHVHARTVGRTAETKKKIDGEKNAEEEDLTIKYKRRIDFD